MQQPTLEQATEFFRLARQLTAMQQSINFIHIDDRTGNLIIVASNDIEAYIRPLGEVSIHIKDDDFDARDRAYVLAHKEDIAAFYAYADRLYAQPGMAITSAFASRTGN